MTDNHTLQTDITVPFDTHEMANVAREPLVIGIVAGEV